VCVGLPTIPIHYMRSYKGPDPISGANGEGAPAISCCRTSTVVGVSPMWRPSEILLSNQAFREIRDVDGMGIWS
jgi:hypothetical protein